MNSAVSVGWIHETRDERHRGEVVDLARPRSAHRIDERALVEEIRLVQRDPGPEVLDALEALGRGAAHEAVDVIALLEQQLREVGAVLPRNASDERTLSLRHGR